MLRVEDTLILDGQGVQGHQWILTVRDSVGQSPKKSLWPHSQQLGIPCVSIRRILVTDLHLYPYRSTGYRLNINLLREICVSGSVTRLMKIKISWMTCGFWMKLIFILFGHVNSKNNIFWGTAPPENCLQCHKVYSMGCHLEAWNHRTILVWRWEPLDLSDTALSMPFTTPLFCHRWNSMWIWIHR